MPRKMKAYMPRWVMWFIGPLLAVVWGFITYLVFATEAGREDPGILGWAMVTTVVVLVGGMIWMMATHRLPAYEIELEDDDPPDVS